MVTNTRTASTVAPTTSAAQANNEPQDHCNTAVNNPDTQAAPKPRYVKPGTLMELIRRCLNCHTELSSKEPVMAYRMDGEWKYCPYPPRSADILHECPNCNVIDIIHRFPRVVPAMA